MANSSGHMSHHGAQGTEWTLVAPDELARLASLQLVATRRLPRVQGGRPPTALVCQSGGVEHHSREASMGQVSTIGLDLAKSIFQVHGADASGAVVFGFGAQFGWWAQSGRWTRFQAMRCDTGIPSRVIRLSTAQPTRASVFWAGRVRARRPRPMTAL